MKIKTIIFWVTILVLIDQVIKIIVNSFFIETQFEIIPSLFEFKPTFNDKHSYLNVLLYQNFHKNIGLYAHIIIFSIIEIVMFVFYAYCRNSNFRSKKLLDFAFVFQLAGVICAFIGNLIWEKGTLDYVYLKPLFIFDLKDLYINCFFIALFLIFAVRNDTEIKKIKIKDVVFYIKHIVFQK
jgi:hypothetical protein